MTASVMTVRGPVGIDKFGFCLPHEHTFIDLPRIHPTQLLAYDFQLIDHSLVTEEVGLYVRAVEQSTFADAGRPMLVELTTGPAMGRDPAALRKLSEDLELYVVMGCGWYREPWFEAGFERLTVRDLERSLLDEIEHGVAGGIRPGIIGELGADRDFVSPAEERVLRAGARAHRKTGLSITLHARGSKVGLAQVETLTEEGVEPGRIIVGHSDSIHDPDYHAELAGLGVWVEFDTVRGKVPYTVERSVRYISEARRRGYLAQLLLSSDNCALSHMQAFGGSGYAYIAGAFCNRLRQAGFSDEELRMLFIENPKRALSGT